MRKKQKITNRNAKKKIILLTATVIAFVLLVAGTVIGIGVFSYYNNAAKQASIVQIRELIILAVKGLKKDAPVEPRSGDVYFPESRLYLPNPSMPLTLTYLMDTGDVTNSQSELSISTYPVRGTEALYIATNTEQLFEAVPKLQACSRGIKVVRQKFPTYDTQNELKHTVRLNTGENVYVYLEKDCPELGETAEKFKNIQAY